jgi:thymidine kinase
MNHETNKSYLELIIGPMYSGKTTAILEIYKKCNFCSIPCIIINHKLDNRYHDTMLCNHDKVMAPCFHIDKLEHILQNKSYLDSDVILINEGQFFTDLYDVVSIMLKQNKKIYICGLDGDFERKKFGSMIDLIPMCDKVTKNTSLCSLCKDGTLGIFSMRLTHEKEQTVVGYDNYIPVCRNCYETTNLT